MERLEQRDAEALVLGQVERGRRLAIGVRQLVLVERPRKLDVARAHPDGQVGELVAVAGADRLAGAEQPGVRRELALEERERADHQVVPLVRREPADAHDERPLRDHARGSGSPNRSGSNRIGTTRTSRAPASRSSRALYSDTAAATSTACA